MAIFGNLQTLINQTTNSSKFTKVFEYLTKITDKNSEEYKRVFSHNINDSVKIELDNNCFVIEQVYITKDKNDCFFESHKKYIDIQFILDGEEIIEVENISNLELSTSYNDEIDLIKYKEYDFASIIKIKKGEGIILYPEDGHMPSVKVDNVSKVIKLVIKLEV